MEGIYIPMGPWRSINIRQARSACIEACLEAMIEARRFTYTDLFIRR